MNDRHQQSQQLFQQQQQQYYQQYYQQDFYRQRTNLRREHRRNAIQNVCTFRTIISFLFLGTLCFRNLFVILPQAVPPATTTSTIRYDSVELQQQQYEHQQRESSNTTTTTTTSQQSTSQQQQQQVQQSNIGNITSHATNVSLTSSSPPPPSSSYVHPRILTVETILSSSSSSSSEHRNDYNYYQMFHLSKLEQKRYQKVKKELNYNNNSTSYKERHDANDNLYPRIRTESHNTDWYTNQHSYQTYEENDCYYITEWQYHEVMPTCNTIHEFGLDNSYDRKWWYFDGGGNKRVWKSDDVPEIVLKTTNLGRKGKKQQIDYTQERLWGDRQDAMIMEQNSASPYILDISGYCAFANIVPSIEESLWEWIRDYARPNHSARRKKQATPYEKLIVATEIAQGVAASHLFSHPQEEEGGGGYHATTIHMDIKPEQFLILPDSNRFVLNDFNRGEYLTYRKKKQKKKKTKLLLSKEGSNNDTTTSSSTTTEIEYEVCKIHHSGSGPRETKYRSPEEYAGNPQDDKVDVFSVGSVMYEILTGREPFWYIQDLQVATSLIENGTKIVIPETIVNSKNPCIEVMVQAISKCHIMNPEKRPKSIDIANMLQTVLNEQKQKQQRQVVEE